MKYASFLLISRALHLNVFDQPVKKYFFDNRLRVAEHYSLFIRGFQMLFILALLVRALDDEAIALAEFFHQIG